MKFYFSLLLLLVTHAVTSQASYSMGAIPMDLLTNANSVVIEQKVEIDISNADRKIVNTYRTIAVLNKLGDEDVNAYAYYDDNSKVKNIEAYVYDANGNELNHFKQKHFRDISAVSGASLYEDDRVLYLDYTPTTYPYILVFSSEVSSNSTMLPTWYPTNGYVSSTLHSELTIKFAPNNKPGYKKENLKGKDILITEGPDFISCVAKNLKAVRYEEVAPPYFQSSPKIRFSQDSFYLQGVLGYSKDWSQFGSWMQQSLLNGTTELPMSTINMVKALVEGEVTNEAKARKIYNYVQNKVRYISVQIGIGGWKPTIASEVDRLSYGDCKALTNYTKALLEAVGVPSYYTILYLDNEERSLSEDIASIQGNHAILGVPDNDEIIWLECTSQLSPFGYVSNSHDDRDVLIVTPEGGKLVHTKKYKVDENTQVSTGIVQINTQGDIKATLKRTSKGLQYGNRYGLTELTDKEREEYYKRRWGYINGFSIPEITFKNDKNEIVFTENVQIQAPNYASSVGDDFLFCVNVFSQSDYVPPRIIDRKQPLYLEMNYKDTDVFEVSIPTGFEFEGLPDNEKIENEFGSYAIAFEKIDESTLKYTREIIIKKGVYPATAYSKYRSFRRNVSKLDKTKILLKQK